MSSTSSDKLLYRIALTKIQGIGLAHAHNIVKIVGDEESVFKGAKSALLSVPGITKRLVEEIRSADVLHKAEKELLFIEKNDIKAIFYTDDDYPERLKNCSDAPILLYQKGEQNLNAKKVVSIVGTRKPSEYGVNVCRKFVEELTDIFPETIIVSGLAYGIDIEAHRTAIRQGARTVAVLAHGLDRVYPAQHRKSAIDIIKSGALITEFSSGTQPERYNFVKRNRIVAGMADAIVVIETAKRGGSLITAEIASSYYKDIFAVPGKIYDKTSEGCNELITNNKATLFSGTESFINQMRWNEQKRKEEEYFQKDIFINLEGDEERVYYALMKQESTHVNQLSIKLDIPISKLLFILLELEMKNLIKAVPGGSYIRL